MAKTCINWINTLTDKNTTYTFQYIVYLYRLIYYPSMTPLTKKQHPSISKTMALPIKQHPDTCTLHSKLVFGHWDRYRDMFFYTLVAPDTSFHSTKFQLCTPIQSKVILTHVNSSSYSLDSLKAPLKSSMLTTISTPPCMHVSKHCLKILIINQNIRVWSLPL